MRKLNWSLIFILGAFCLAPAVQAAEGECVVDTSQDRPSGDPCEAPQGSLRRKIGCGFNAEDRSNRACGMRIVLNSNVTLRSQLVIDGDEDGVIIESADATAREININFDVASAPSQAAIIIKSPNVILKNIKITGARGGVALLIESTGNTVEGSTFSGNGTGIKITGGNNTIWNLNRFENNSDYGVVSTNSGNLISNNIYNLNIRGPIQTPNTTMNPTIVNPSHRNGIYTVSVRTQTSVQKIEVYRNSLTRSGTVEGDQNPVLLASVETNGRNQRSLSFRVRFEATSDEEVYAIAFLNRETSNPSPLVALSSAGLRTGANGDCSQSGRLNTNLTSIPECTPRLGPTDIDNGPDDTLDTDCDGLMDIVEDANGNCVRDGNESHFGKWDADGDLIDDITETNGDGNFYDCITQYDEIGLPRPVGTECDTNPNSDDTDQDEILDGFEDRDQDGSKDNNETDPTKKDTDGDGISDTQEDKNLDGIWDNGTITVVNPNTGIVCTAYKETKGFSKHTDRDGIEDGVEDKDHSGGAPSANETDPRMDDTNCDTVNDAVDEFLFNPLPEETCLQQCRRGVASGVDSDGDDLSDAEEDFNFSCSTDLPGETDRCKPDSDGDGCTDLEEINLGYDPLNHDMDGDNIDDCLEDRNKDGRLNPGETDPKNRDTDGDGYPDFGARASRGEANDPCPRNGDPSCRCPFETNVIISNPNHDSDGDLVPDELECSAREGLVCLSNDLLHMNPCNPDSDGDGSPDGSEDSNKNGHRDENETIPTNPDSDGDGLKDGSEDLNHDGQPQKGECSPLNNDSDGDEILDDVEVTTGTQCDYNDSDSDGLLDGDEDKNHDGHVGLDETDPRVRDTDGDGAEDDTDPHPLVQFADDLTTPRGLPLHNKGGCSLNPNASDASIGVAIGAWAMLLMVSAFFIPGVRSLIGGKKKAADE